MVETALNTGQINGLWCDYGALYDRLRTGFDVDEIEFLGFDEMQTYPGGFIG